MISLVESFLCPDKQGTPEEGWNIVSTNNNKDEDISPKNHNQNNSHLKKFQQIVFLIFSEGKGFLNDFGF